MMPSRNRAEVRDVFKCISRGHITYVENPSECAGSVEKIMEDRQRLALSKLMSALLRHIPGEAGLKPDPEGWVTINALLHGIRNVWRNRNLYQWVSEEHIRAVAALDPKGRFEIKGSLIRARYGHTIKVAPKYEEDQQIRTLYHGTTLQAWMRIQREGIKPGRRLWVHLTNDPRIAFETGRRHGPQVRVLRVNAECLRRRGFRTYRASKNVWVVKEVPPECIEGET